MIVFLSNGKLIKFSDNSALHSAGAGFSYRNYATGFQTTVSAVTYNNIIVGKEVGAISAFNYTSTPTVPNIADGVIAS